MPPAGGGGAVCQPVFLSTCPKLPHHGHSHWIPPPRVLLDGSVGDPDPSRAPGPHSNGNPQGFLDLLKKIGGFGAAGTQNLWTETGSTIGSQVKGSLEGRLSGESAPAFLVNDPGAEWLVSFP